MKKYLMLIALSVCLFIQTGTAKAQSIQSYIEKYDDLCKQLSEAYGIPASIIMSVAIVESGAGRSRNAKLLNNHFGIVGKNNLAPTVKTKYKQYSSIEASFVAFCKLLTRKSFYSSMKEEDGAEKWVIAISKAGYSTSPSVWKKQVMYAINKYNLEDLDQQIN